jgi:hypothetical protein
MTNVRDSEGGALGVGQARRVTSQEGTSKSNSYPGAHLMMQVILVTFKS